MIRPRIQVFPDAEDLAQGVAAWFCGLAGGTDRIFAVCLSGGSTPKRLFEILGGPDFVNRFPWTRVHWFWGDERFVPPDDPSSNYRMVREALLSRAPVPEANVHPIPTVGLTPAEAAVAYERELKLFYGDEALERSRPLFDVTFLGLGTDGHTASLFPGTAVLEERKRWVASVIGVKPEPRITLTYPVLESSRNAAFLVAGEDKRSTVRRVLNGEQVPAARLHPAGELYWFLDEAAAPEGVAGGEGLAAIDQEAQKKAAALAAVEQVSDGMVVGLGTGSTAHYALIKLAERVRSGLRITAIPTSEATAAMARDYDIPLTSFAEHVMAEITIDGADEVERRSLALIKGRGGALLREKIVASASDRVVIIVDQSKLVEQLGAQAPVPVEITPFGWEATSRKLQEMGAVPTLRSGPGGGVFVTDGGNYILDCAFGPIADPRALADRLATTVGVIESGLFVDMADQVIAAGPDGIEILGKR